MPRLLTPAADLPLSILRLSKWRSRASRLPVPRSLWGTPKWRSEAEGGPGSRPQLWGWGIRFSTKRINQIPPPIFAVLFGILKGKTPYLAGHSSRSFFFTKTNTSRGSAEPASSRHQLHRAYKGSMPHKPPESRVLSGKSCVLSGSAVRRYESPTSRGSAGNRVVSCFPPHFKKHLNLRVPPALVL